MNLRRLILTLPGLALLLALAACAAESPVRATHLSPERPAPTIEASEASAGDASPQPTSPQPTPPTPTSTPAPVAAPDLAFLSEDGSRAEALREVVRAAGARFGWLVAEAGEVEPLARAGTGVLVVDGPALAARAQLIAGSFPDTYFILLSPVEGELAPNVLGLGGPDDREDQAAFLAGMAAGLASQRRFVAAIGQPETASGRQQANGFLHGVRYACPACRVDFIPAGDPAEMEKQVAIFISGGADVFFGPADLGALRAAAEKGAWVIGAGGDVAAELFENGSAPGAERALTSVYLDLAQALEGALAAFQQGQPLAGRQPLSAALGAVRLSPYRGEGLSALDQQDLALALARLADGSLETGVDPLTGEER